jgi:S1-C subfamily serine protease
MQETDGKSQKIALGLIVIAVVIGLGMYSLLELGVIKSNNIASKPTVKAQSAQDDGMPPGGPGSSGSNCPSTQVGEILGAEMLHGHGTLANGGSGAMLETVNSKGPGAKAGLKDGDVVSSCNGTQTTCPSGLLKALQTADTTKPIKLDIERAGKPMTITVEPGQF